jgi:hypothetical protein
MTTPGWIMMIVSMGFVICLFLFCFYRVLAAHNNRESVSDRPSGEPRDWEDSLRDDR